MNGKFDLMSDLLELKKNKVDNLCFQEPSWKLIRRTVLSSDKKGDPVRGTALHPDWTTIFHNPRDDADILRCIPYVSNRLKKFRPTYRTDIVDHRDVQLITLWTSSNEFHIMNVYSDAE